MKPADVHCARCLALPNEPCTTTGKSKRTTSFHLARIRLARTCAPCPQCSAGATEPCVYPNGSVRMRTHYNRRSERSKQ